MRLIDADKMREEVRASDAVLYERRGVINLIEQQPTALRLKKAMTNTRDYRAGEYEMFVRMTTSYFGKPMYFLQDDGMVFSKVSCMYMTAAEAYEEFEGWLSVYGGF